MAQFIHSTRPKDRTILAVRLLVARTAWLDGRHYWRDGSVSWDIPGESVIPDAAVLSRAQRHLNKIAGFPNAARLVVGDLPLWLEQKRERLTRLARQRDASVAPELAQLLIAEALCLNTLPESPSAALAALGPPAAAALRDVILSGQTPAAGRALAALTLGAVSQAADSREGGLFPALTNAWQSRTFAWSARHGLPAHPALISALLAADEDTAGRGQRSVEGRADFGLPVQMLRELLADGLLPAVVSELAEAAADAGTVLEQMLSVRAVLPDPQKQWDRRQVAITLRAERRQTVQALADAVAAYAQMSRDPGVVRLVTDFLRRTLDMIAPLAPNPETTAVVLEQAQAIAQTGLTLPSARHRDYWELLTAQIEAFWASATLTPDLKPRRAVSQLRSWLHDAQIKHIGPLCRLLASAQDKVVVAAIFDLGLQQVLAKQIWTDPDLYRLFVTIAAELEMTREYSAWELCRVLSVFPSARDARTYFQAFLQPLRACTPSRRQSFLETLLNETDGSRGTLRQELAGILPLLPALVKFAETETNWNFAGYQVFDAALMLAHYAPAAAKERTEQMLNLLPDGAWRRSDYGERHSLQTGLLLAAALAGDDAAQFGSAVQTAGQHQFRQDQQQIKDGFGLLKRFPHLRQPIAALFARQPQRVAEMLVKLGLTTRLSTDITPLLACLEPQAAPDGLPGTAFPIFLQPDRHCWSLHRQMPDLTVMVNAYLHACRLQDRSQELPAGVRRVLDRPQRIKTEIAHLEKVLATDPQRAGIAARVAKLRALRDDEAQLAEEIGAEVRERLPHAAAEAQAAAIEGQILACYRTRLEAVAGPLPPGTVLTEDLLNAALLTVDITQNRKLLLHLIRAALDGDHGWRERHPANHAFLASLAARGVNTAFWLSAFPCRFACAGVPGGRVHLRAEQDPLHILQMGNYFETCLSFGGINSFSTVANACELNKRVIYACDSAGRVVGRKLIGLNAEGEMIGFHTYCSLSEETGQALRAVFRQYAARFADRCGLHLADQGTVPLLFAEAWYDDEAAAWSDDTADTAPVSS